MLYVSILRLAKLSVYGKKVCAICIFAMAIMILSPSVAWDILFQAALFSHAAHLREAFTIFMVPFAIFF